MKRKTFELKSVQAFFVSQKITLLIFFVLIIVAISSALFLNNRVNQKNNDNLRLENKLKLTSAKLNDFQNQDQYKINQKLKKNIDDIQFSYKISVDLYQKILDLRAQKVNTSDLDNEFAQTLEYLYNLNYSSVSASLKTLASDIQKKEDSLVFPSPVAQIAQPNNSPPSGGFSVQSVSTDNGSFTVSIVAADLNSTKVIVDTASSGDCSNNCPTLPLSDYVSRNGAFAGINGSYFCPVEYPSCANKTGSFDLLVMNKNKVYFNSSNNVYSTNPAVIFSGNSARFVGQVLEWGRDTGVDSVISNYPLLILGGNISYSGGGDAKYAPKGIRTFIAVKGNTVFIGAVLNASMADSAKVLKTLGMDNALNLDQGGSTALWSGGYKLGPGRSIPNALLFVRK